MAEHMTEAQPDGRVPTALGTLLDVVLDDDQVIGGRTRPHALLAAALACALMAAVLAGSVGGRVVYAVSPETTANR